MSLDRLNAGLTCNTVSQLIDSLEQQLKANFFMDSHYGISEQEFDDIIEWIREPNDFMLSLSDSDIAKIISDTRIDWTQARVGSGNSFSHSLLSQLMLLMPMDEPVPWSPLTCDALNLRYSPSEQVTLLKRSDLQPHTSLRILGSRQVLTGRLVCMALQSQEHLNVWVDEWMASLKTSLLKMDEAIKKQGTQSLNNLETTAAYNAIEPKKTVSHAFAIVMSIAWALDPEQVEASVDRYITPSLYKLTDPELYPLFLNADYDLLRSGIIYVLQALDKQPLNDLISTQIKGYPLDDDNRFMCAALLSRCFDWNQEWVPVADLIKVKDSFLSRTAIDNLVDDYLGEWRSEWFDRANIPEHGKPLLDAIGQYDCFKAWAMRYSVKTSWGTLEDLTNLPHWINLMSKADQEKTFEFLSTNFESGISSQKRYGSGIIFGKLLISAFPDDDFAQAIISNQVGYIVKRALHDDHLELLKVVLEKDLITPDVVGKCVWNIKEFKKLTDSGEISRELLIPYVKSKVKIDLFEDDLGL